MHSDGQMIMQSPQAIHFVFPRSSFSKYSIPLHRLAGGRFSSGYWIVIGLEKNLLKVSHKPFNNGIIIWHLYLLSILPMQTLYSGVSLTGSRSGIKRLFMGTGKNW